MDLDNRVIALIDMDCFYCQVEEKLNPELKGKPIAVVQYNPWKGGGIIAVNYVARARGVTRHMRGDEAKEQCPDIELPSVPCVRGKANISKYRDAGKEVARVLQKFTSLLERASIDEAYLDITAPVIERLKHTPASSVTSSMLPNTFALGYDSIEEYVADVHGYGTSSMDFDYEHSQMLLVGAVIVSEIRAAVYEETGFRCSAGISHNKILAKLVCGMNKPNKQTVLPKHTVNILYTTLPVKKVKHLGGKFGYTVCDVLKIKNMAELLNFSEKELQSKFDEKNGTWLYNIARGMDHEPVQARFNPKSIGCCKNFKGKSALVDYESLVKWLKDLGDEIEDRLEKDALENNRTPKQMVVSFSTQLNDGRDTSSSRSYNFTADDELCVELFSSKALELVLESTEGVKPKEGQTNRRLKAPIKFLGISVGKFEDHTESKKTRKIMDFFSAGSTLNPLEKINKIETKNESKLSEGTASASRISEEQKNGKDFILKKFFQVTKEQTVNNNSGSETDPPMKQEPVIESTLDKQESFFTKLLSKKQNQDNSESVMRSTTPICKVINHGDDSNDTNYSGSTINDEINKSIALFEDDPQDIARVSEMRQLLNQSGVKDLVDTFEKSSSPVEETKNVVNETEIVTFDCQECKKAIPVKMFETHADYHLALRIRDEERQQMRQEKKEKVTPNISKSEERKNKLVAEETIKNDYGASISSFFVKVDSNTPTELCTECGKKVPISTFPEHLDFHQAQKLSRELNKKSTPSLLSYSSKKKKRKLDSPVKKNSKLPCKSIDSFFRS